jgi:hypothetical protein
MPPRSRPFCADISRDSAESLAATASRVDHWIVIEYRGLWGYDAVDSSGLSSDVRKHLRACAAALGRTKILFVRRTERRHGPLRVFWASSAERGSRVWGVELERYDELLEVDFAGTGDEVGHPLLLVCTHGKHDPCCARLGRPLYEAVRDQVDEGWAWQCTHVGGDRFAGNLVCLPEGLYFGRVGPAEAWAVLDEYLSRRLQLELYRGRSCYSFPIQAAERAVREGTGLRGLDDLELVGIKPIQFRAGRRVYEVEVSPETGELTYLTCRAAGLRHPTRFVAGSLRERAV